MVTALCQAPIGCIPAGKSQACTTCDIWLATFGLRCLRCMAVGPATEQYSNTEQRLSVSFESTIVVDDGIVALHKVCTMEETVAVKLVGVLKHSPDSKISILKQTKQSWQRATDQNLSDSASLPANQSYAACRTLTHSVVWILHQNWFCPY